MKSRRTFLVTVHGIALSKPSTTRAKAMRSRHWWARRCPGLPEVTRIRRSPS